MKILNELFIFERWNFKNVNVKIRLLYSMQGQKIF